MADYRLKGHEKFTLREGWLNKGLLGVNKDSRIFSGVEGADKLGVGANMVKSIRYWMQVFNLIEENKKLGTLLTPLGKIILENDPYFEEKFTLWLMHSNISQNASRATTWYLFFNRCEASEFSKDDLREVLKKELIKYIESDKVSESSIKDDIDVLLNMYSKENINDDPEDKKNSPLSILGLIKKDGDVYIKQQPELRKFDEWVVLYELSSMFENEQSLSIDVVADKLEKIYSLSKVTVNMFLDKLENEDYIDINRTAGLDVIYQKNIGNQITVVEEYYKQHK